MAPLTVAQLKHKFGQQFRETAGRKLALARAPGRINLIGEHTDYNEGLVFPAAVDRATFVSAQRRADTQVWVYSSNMEEKVTFDIRTMKNDPSHGWANYPKGVMSMLLNQGWKLEGMNVFIESDVPLGGGMSSSASLELATAYACLQLFPYQMDRLNLVKLCQRAENAFVGVSCGIIDQFSSAFGKKGHAIMLDCRTLSFQHVPVPQDSHRILVVNSMVKRRLAGGEYNKRREQCNEAVKALKAKYPQLKALRDLKVSDLPEALPLLGPIPRKRAEHVVRECQRVTDAVEALKAKDMAAFGRLLNESHKSLKELYEVSCTELDILAEACRKAPGAVGARMMGGGFGGCVIAVVAASEVAKMKNEVSRTYQTRCGMAPQIYDVQLDDGAGELKA